jgi:hypothetical protein
MHLSCLGCEAPPVKISFSLPASIADILKFGCEMSNFEKENTEQLLSAAISWVNEELILYALLQLVLSAAITRPNSFQD